MSLCLEREPAPLECTEDLPTQPASLRQVQRTPQDYNIALWGFFQSFVFFDHRREEIQELFTLPTKYETEAQDRLEWLIKGIAVCGFH